MLLVPFSVLVSFQLFKLVQSELFFYKFSKIDANNCTNDHLFLLIKILLRKKLWLTSINLMESQKNISGAILHKYFNTIGYIYQSMGEFNIACLYYKKAINVKDNYIVARQNLAKIHEKVNSSLDLSTYKSLIKHDQNNAKAKKYTESNEC